MEKIRFKLSGKDVTVIGDLSAKKLFIQPTGKWETEFLEAEFKEVERLNPGVSLCLAAFTVDDWNSELSPWESEAVFGNESFGSGAAATLDFIETELIPALEKKLFHKPQKRFLCGYSLAGLFSLWTAYQTEQFDGVAGVSPSVWFPGFTEYAKTHKIKSRSVYLSLGKKEEKARNPLLASVGNAIREQFELTKSAGIPCILEWNEGNHFVDADIRLAKGIAWLERNI